MATHELTVSLDSAMTAFCPRASSQPSLSCRAATALAFRLIAVTFALGLSGFAGSAEPLPRSVLMLDQSGPGSLNPGYSEISRVFRTTLIAKSPARIYAMNLDLNDFSAPRYHAALRSFVEEKYGDVPIGVIFAVGSAALEFAIELRDGRWSGVPVVFAAADEDTAARLVGSDVSGNVTGLTLRLSLKKSIDVARTLVPRLNKIVLIGDRLEQQPFRRHFKSELAEWAPDLALVDLTGLPLADVTKRLASLPDDAAILYTAMTSDGAGTTYLPHEALESLAKSANRPIVVDVDNRIGRGATGGYVVRPAIIGEEAAVLVSRILEGEHAWQIPVAVSDSMRPIFDWGQLKRWGIREAQLPADSEFRFHQPTAWEQYRTQIIIIFLTVLFQSALIGALFYEDRRRRAAEARSLELSGVLAHVNRVATAGELAASIAHEIRQPLAAIVARGSAGLNWLKREAPDLDKVRSALENIVDNGHRADQVLRNTRAMFGKGDASQSTLNVNDVIAEVLALIEARMAEAHIRLSTAYGDMPAPLVRANRVQLQQVLLNLVMNAIEAMSAKSGGDRVLRVTTEVSRTGRVLINVQDSGPGIAPDQLDMIYRSFFTTKPGGMGVGLAICKTIVEALGGQLTAANGDSAGMVFTINLPLRTQQRAGNHSDATQFSERGL